MSNGSIEERILKRGRDSQGKMRNNLKVYDVRYSYVDKVRSRGIFIRNKSTSK